MKIQYLLIMSAALICAGCSNDPAWDGEVTDGVYRYSTFDFATTFDCDLTFNVGHRVYASVYTEDPDANPHAEAVRTVWTDYEGHYSCQVTLPKAMIGQRLYATLDGVTISADVTAKGCQFTYSSRSVDTAELQPSAALCKAIKDDYLARMPQGNGNTDNRSRLVETGELAVQTKEDNTQILFTFIHSFGWNTNLMYYYYYTGDDPVTEENRDEYIQKFCSDDRFLCTKGWQVKITSDPTKGNPASDTVEILTEGGNGGINFRFDLMGQSNYLHYYGPDYDQEADTHFPKDVKIGFILNSVTWGTRKDNRFPFETAPRHYFFANPNVNEPDANGNKIHVGRFWSSDATENSEGISRFVYGYEDSMKQTVNDGNDYNFTDFLCMISTNPSAYTDNVATLSATYSSTSGTIMFEDRFPEQGDYDMNDVILEYRKVMEIERVSAGGNDRHEIRNAYVDIMPVHYGAQYSNDVYVQCHDKSGNKVCEPQKADFIKEVGLPLWAAAEYNKRQITTSTSPNLKTVRIYLIKDYVPTGSSVPSHYLDSEILDDDIDIFINVINTGREVHLTNHRHAGIGSLEGLNENQKLYRAQESDRGFYPWAMNIPMRSAGKNYIGFIPVTEGINIAFEYLGFADWVSSNGGRSTNWYLNQNYRPYVSE